MEKVRGALTRLTSKSDAFSWGILLQKCVGDLQTSSRREAIMGTSLTDPATCVSASLACLQEPHYRICVAKSHCACVSSGHVVLGCQSSWTDLPQTLGNRNKCLPGFIGSGRRDGNASPSLGLFPKDKWERVLRFARKPGQSPLIPEAWNTLEVVLCRLD